MPKIKIPKSSPSIDMTPMVDLAFLLVTFFMLSASFRSSEPVEVDVPSSISDIIIPENVIQVSIDKGGVVFFNMSDAEARKELLANMAKKYNVTFNEEQFEKFSFMTSFGCKIKELPNYIDKSAEERKLISTGISTGVPDSLDNQLRDWIYYGNAASLNSGKTAYEAAKLKGESPNINDFKPKFILKVDNTALYAHAQNVINVFRDLNLNNLNFITSLEVGSK